jgi:hypothetical protein
MRRFDAVVLSAALAACDTPPPPMEMPPPVEDGGPTGLLALPEEGVQIATEPYDLEPSGEDIRCFYRNLKNTDPMHVVRFRTGKLPGLHHFNVYLSDLEKNDGWGRCPTGDEFFHGARPIVDGSGSTVDYQFPDGLALELHENALIIMEVHFLNPTRDPKPQQFVLNLHSETGGHELVDIYGYTNFDIHLPPHETTNVSKDCIMRDRVRMLTMSTHFHARGIRATGELIRNGTTEPELLYETTNWAEPTVLKFEEPLFVGEGDTIRFTCTYKNDDDFEVEWGVDAKDEMCFLFGYYYPKVGLIPCF